MSASRYKEAGVDIAAGARAVDMMRQAVESTHGGEVLSSIGTFGGMYDASLKEMDAPILVASTDSVGTKTMVAAALSRYDTIGQDLVIHCVNDILVQGARPLFFLDYFASSHLAPEIVAQVVGGCAVACREAGCALLGGETAELPGVYLPEEFDLAGTIVGVVERSKIVDGRAVRAGDAVIGLAATGLHTNGYSLARRVFEAYDWERISPELGESLGDALLAVHRCYLDHVVALWRDSIEVRAMGHITGGGLVDNLVRTLPEGVGVEIRSDTWFVPPIFPLIQQTGNVALEEMRYAFNLGIGFTLIVSQDMLQRSLDILNSATLPGDAWCIGKVVAGKGVHFMDMQ